MIVCLCNNVSSGDIAQEAASGCCSFESLQEKTMVGMCCGACLPCAKETFAEHRTGSANRARRTAAGAAISA